MQQDSAGDDLLSVTQAASELGISERRVSKLCHDGRLGKRFGCKVYLISRRELTEFAKIPRRPGPPKGSRRKKHHKSETSMSEREAKKLSKSWNKIGKWIKQQRECRELTQRELLYKLKAHKLKVYQPDVSFWETGEHIPDVKTCLALSKVFNVDVRDVLALAAETKLSRDIEAATSM